MLPFFDDVFLLFLEHAFDLIMRENRHYGQGVPSGTLEMVNDPAVGNAPSASGVTRSPEVQT